MKKDIKLVLATSNPGKLNEIKRVANAYSMSILCPSEAGIDTLEVAETGKTFKENATLKLKAYLEKVTDPNIYIVADDSGLEIPALNNEPGVYTRRWAGHEMKDDEILKYCLEKMRGMTGDQRKAKFITILAVGNITDKPHYYSGELWGEILPEPKPDVEKVLGFPFRSVFYVTEQDKMIYELQDGQGGQEKAHKSHREIAFLELLNSLEGLNKTST